jgi:very-short-patch-repair endonuclease
MKTVQELCRELRKNQTEAEKVLWQLLRNRKLAGYKFLRQYPLCKVSYSGYRTFYIADFYCAQKRLVIEADGPIHLERKDYDKNRDEVMLSQNITTLRFTNEKVLHDSEQVLKEILLALQS